MFLADLRSPYAGDFAVSSDPSLCESECGTDDADHTPGD